MTWNTPTTWTAGAVLTATQLNEQVRDNLKVIGDHWASYAPAWTGSVTDPDISNGTITGAYMAAGNLIAFRIAIFMGPTTDFGSGSWRLALPFPASTGVRWNFTGVARDTSSGDFYPLHTFATGSPLTIGVDGTSAGGPLRSITPTVPFTWANTDELHLHGVYEAA